MKRPKWFRKFRTRSISPTVLGKLYCQDCNRPIKKRHKYRIVIARHIDCTDPKQIGQPSFPLLKESE
jgi:hypothetical protein